MDKLKQKEAEGVALLSSPAFSKKFALSDLPPSDLSVIQTLTETIFATYSPQQSQILEYNIRSSNTHHLKLDSIKLYLKIRIRDKDGKKLPTSSATSLENLALSTMFSGCQVFINNVCINQHLNNYPFTAFFHRMFFTPAN